MKNSILFIATITFVFFLTGCQKDNTINELAELESTKADIEKTLPTLDQAQVIAVDSITDAKAMESELEDRSGRTQIFERTYSIEDEDLVKVYIRKEQMNPNFKYIAVLRVYEGNPDLYTVGSTDNNYSTNSYVIRYDKSLDQRDKETYVCAHDLRESDNYIYFSAFARNYSHFKLSIYKERIPHSYGPEISFVTPAHTEYYERGARLYVKVNARDNSGVRYVKLYINGEFVRTEHHAPYEWGTRHNENDTALDHLEPGGMYDLRVVATDRRGYTSEKTMTVHMRY